jgi:hypothetical protein
MSETCNGFKDSYAHLESCGPRIQSRRAIWGDYTVIAAGSPTPNGLHAP